jgi:hypothetical protein
LWHAFVGVWKLNRYHERRGVLIGVPFSIQKSRKPRLFRSMMILGWMSLALVIAFSLLVSAAFVGSWL